MPLQQLLVRPHRGRQPELEAVDNPGNKFPAEFDDVKTGAHAPHLGSEDLLRVAAALATYGYRVVGLDVRDSSYRSIDPLELEDLERIALPRLRAGRASEVVQLFQRSLVPRFVQAVELREPDGARRVKIGVDGLLSILPPGGQTSQRLLERLQSIWAQVGLD